MNKAHTNTLLALSISFLISFKSMVHLILPRNIREPQVFGSKHWLEMDYRLYTNNKVLNGSFIATHLGTVHLSPMLLLLFSYI